MASISRTTWRFVGPLVLIVCAGGAGAGDPAFHYVEVAGECGIGPYAMAYGMGGGAAAADYDGDGDVDLFVPNGFGTPDQLYRNLGDGTFEEVAAASGVAGLASNRAALWLDHDGDGDLDLLVVGDCWHALGKCTEQTSLRLYRQEADGRFTDVTAPAGLWDLWLEPDSAHVGGLAAGDVNNDGHLDVVLSAWEGDLHLFVNAGDGTFLDASQSSGLGGVLRLHWQPLVADLDGDGWQDVLVLVDFGPNLLFVNERDGTFTERAGEVGLANDMNDMGVAAGDYDNDGDLDLYITNIFDDDPEDPKHNVLLRNDSADGVMSFTEVAVAAGVDDGRWGWGTTFLDADLDGRLDLAATNGWFAPNWINDPSRFFHNLGGRPVSFADVSSAVGFDDEQYGSALVAFDRDRDGDLDLLQTCNAGGPLRLLDGRLGAGAAPHHWLVVAPRTEGPNRRAIGAVVRVEAGGLVQTRLISAGTSFQGQEPAEAHFGLGKAPVADLVSVRWPGGGYTALAEVAIDRVLPVVAGAAPGDLNADGAVGIGDLLILLSWWGPCPDPARCVGDLDGDSAVGSADLQVLLDEW